MSSTAEPKNGPIRVGFVGLSSSGWAAGALGPSLLDPEVRKHYKLVAVSTTKAESAAASAAHYSKLWGHEIKAYHGDANQIAADPDVDLVVISVSPLYHKEIAEKAILNGKPFFLEWQAGRGQETMELARLAKERGVRSMIGLQARQSNALKLVKSIVSSGNLGTLLSTNVNILLPREMKIFAPHTVARYGFVNEKGSGVTPISTPLGHILELFTLVLGPIARVSASGTILYPEISLVDEVTGQPTGKTLPNQYPDHITINGVLKNSGAWISILLRVGHPSTPGRSQLEWTIEGEEGTLKVEDTRPVGMNLGSHDPENIFLNGKKLEWEVFENVVTFLRSMWLEFPKGKEGGGDFVDIHDAARVKAALYAMEESLFDGGRWVSVQELDY